VTGRNSGSEDTAMTGEKNGSGTRVDILRVIHGSRLFDLGLLLAP
jgi:hypothetical protein